MTRVSILAIIFIFLGISILNAQPGLSSSYSWIEVPDIGNHFNKMSFSRDTTDTTDTTQNDLPSPKSVLFKSLMVPGWGQIENKQIWKVPIVYALFAGVGAYTIFLNNQYKDYRAAFYNSNQDEDNDFRFGPTPERLQNVSGAQLQSQRNSFRNQRDFMFVVMGLAYGLNALDAYIFAHMRSFDVSDDLSANTKIEPTILHEGTPGIRVTLTLY